MRAVTSSPAYSDVANISPRSLEECNSDFEEAFGLSQRLDWLAGQAFTGLERGFVFASFGEFGRGQTCLREALATAKNIEHEQWTVGAQTFLGRLYLYRLDGDQAFNILKQANENARKLGSALWSGYSAAWLSLAYLLKNNLEDAEEVLNSQFPPGHKALSIAERMISWAWCELRLAQGKYHEALKLTEQLIGQAGGEVEHTGSPTLYRLKGDALRGLGRLEEAVAVLVAAKNMALKR
jgi:tetratricopeptide (TPR) repeat protein